MKVVILAAGYGTRLLKDLQEAKEEQYAKLAGVPKPLLPIGKLPLISYWVEALKASDDTQNIFVVTNELYYRKFKEWAENYPCVQVINDGTSSNEERLGAVSCLQLAIDRFKIDDHIMVIGGDTLFYEDFHLQRVLEKYEALHKVDDQANLVLSYSCKEEEMRKYGILETDENQKITALLEKPSATDTTSRQADAPISEKDAPGLFLSWLVKRKPVYCHPLFGRFDVGNLESYIKCNDYFKEKIHIPNYLQ
ncbi:PREDICTED: uncharacterized protein LOC108801531 isoform X2 [Nanorana parkeri]|uniref:uncharacterized protein LOC108801531 isoform X2 n=1 Tax=Nanorana parkeri TaxID=125878 RepID=UPI0008547E25|nr:PREDICTED: uncharacterized protein LOC108801531 isoform X2 [Nanorana parkeri]